MRKLLFIFVAALFAACNPIPDKSIFEDLSTEELASIIKSDSNFAEFYENIHSLMKISMFSDIQKTEYKDVTYRRLYKYYHHNNFEPEYWNPLMEQWSKEWGDSMAKDLAKVDEKSEYWLEYKKQNTLSKYANIELSDFFITHYNYVGGVDKAYIMFKITPLQGTIEQLKFTYSYSYKINGGNSKEVHMCICSSPISKQKEGAWEIDYWKKEKFDGMTVEKFLQQYDLEIEITDVRIDGKNYSLDELNIPESVLAFWEEDTPENRDAVALLVNPNYVNKEQYISNKKTEDLKKFDILCYEFSEALMQNSLLNGLKKIFE